MKCWTYLSFSSRQFLISMSTDLFFSSTDRAACRVQSLVLVNLFLLSLSLVGLRWSEVHSRFLPSHFHTRMLFRNMCAFFQVPLGHTSERTALWCVHTLRWFFLAEICWERFYLKLWFWRLLYLRTVVPLLTLVTMDQTSALSGLVSGLLSVSWTVLRTWGACCWSSTVLTVEHRSVSFVLFPLSVAR